MIHIDYDIATSGVRVSFLIQDEDLTRIGPPERQFAGGVSEDGRWTAPQSFENKKVLIAMLEATCADDHD